MSSHITFLYPSERGDLNEKSFYDDSGEFFFTFYEDEIKDLKFSDGIISYNLSDPSLVCPHILSIVNILCKGNPLYTMKSFINEGNRFIVTVGFHPMA